MTWQELLDDPVLQRLPYRKEFSKWGNIEMSRLPTAHHVEQVARISALLRELRADGKILVDAAIETVEKIKLVDLVWMTAARHRDFPRGFVFTAAPEICVEVLTHEDFLKEYLRRTQLFLQAGAEEVWLCDEPGDMRFFDASGPLERSRLCPDFPAKIELRR